MYSALAGACKYSIKWEIIKRKELLMRRLEMRKNLKEARQKAGMTQQDMADKLGISLRYYQNIEAGSRTGEFTLWDTLEDITGIHQRILRELS